MMGRYKHSSNFGKAISRVLLWVISHNRTRGISMIVKSLWKGNSHPVVGYTAHQRRCLFVEEMVALGMMQNAKGWWQMPTRVKAVAGIVPGEVYEEEEEQEEADKREVT